MPTSRRTKWHTIAYNILAMLCFARNGLLIAYHISGFVFDVIMLGEIRPRKANQR